MVTTPKPTVNLRMRDTRAKKGWSQPELARRAKLSIATINQSEVGRRLPHYQTQERIARTLGVERTWLFPEPEEEEAL